MLSRRHRRPSSRSAFVSEAMEDRCLLATITVTSAADSVADDGEVTLREAIKAANTNASVDGSVAGSGDVVDVIEFAEDVTSILLTDGQFDISESVTIRGPEGRVTIDAQSNSRHFEVTTTGQGFTVENMQLINGETAEDSDEGGGAIRVGREFLDGGSLTVRNSVLDNNNADFHGGAIYAGGEPEGDEREQYTMLLVDSIFSNNVSGGSGGSVLITGNAHTQIEGSTFSDSTAANQAGGIMIYDMAESGDPVGIATAEVIGSTFTGNVSNGRNGTSGNGAGLYYFGDGTIMIDSSTFTGNTANFGGGLRLLGRGGATQIVRNSTVTGNTARDDGGGIVGDVIEITNTLVANNTADNGGGLYLVGDGDKVELSAIVETSTIRDNMATESNGSGGAVAGIDDMDIVIRDSRIVGNRSQGNGGGIAVAGALQLTRSVVAENRVDSSVSSGGGIYLRDASLDMRNSTVVGNFARNEGAGIWVGGTAHDIGIRSSTIVRNQGIGLQAEDVTGSLTIESSIIAENGTFEERDTMLDVAGELQVTASLIGVATGGVLHHTGATSDANGNLIGSQWSSVEAGLTYTGMLGDSGPFVALLPTSPAIDAGSNSLNETLDNRGAIRVQGASIDMGAFEGSPEMYLEFGNTAVVEGDDDSTLDFTVTLIGESDEVVTTAYETANDSASFSSDYEPVSGTLEFAGVDGEMQSIEIPILGDTEIEANETFKLRLTISGGGVGFMSPLSTVVSEVGILNDDLGAELKDDGVLFVASDETDDSLSVVLVEDNYEVTLNGSTETFQTFRVSSANIDLGHGNNSIDLSPLIVGFPEVQIRTGDGNDTVVGTSGPDWIAVGGGDDSVDGKKARDTVFGGAGNDSLKGGDGADVLFGGSGLDRLSGGGNHDSLLGGDGSDTLIGGRGMDTLAGHAGKDSLVGGGGADQISGGPDDDTLSGGSDNDRLDGDGGHDLAFGSSGADAMFGGDGHDTMTGGGGRDTLAGGEGNDQLSGGDDIDTLRGEAGDDSLGGGAGNDSLNGGKGGDSLRGGQGNDLLDGGDGNDTVRGGAGNDRAFGRDGDDIITLDDGDDTAIGGAGADVIRLDDGNNQAVGGDGNDTILGGDGNDVIDGGDGADRIEGRRGVDVLVGGHGRDTLLGGDGADLLVSSATTLSTSDLSRIQAEWANTERTYEVRLTNIRGGVNRTFDRLNGREYLRKPTQANATIESDAAPLDVLFGGDGRDLFFARKVDGEVDQVFRDMDELLVRI